VHQAAAGSHPLCGATTAGSKQRTKMKTSAGGGGHSPDGGQCNTLRGVVPQQQAGTLAAGQQGPGMHTHARCVGRAPAAPAAPGTHHPSALHTCTPPGPMTPALPHESRCSMRPSSITVHVSKPLHAQALHRSGQTRRTHVHAARRAWTCVAATLCCSCVRAWPGPHTRHARTCVGGRGSLRSPGAPAP
jgi:hypothetical protein